MQLKYGSSRIVLLLPSLGVAIKFPRIRVIDTVKVLWQISTEGRPHFWKRLALFLNQPFGDREWYGLGVFLLNGICHNRSEYRFWQEIRNPFVWPTTFSLWGLVNIQPLGKEPTTWDGMWKAMAEIAGQDLMEDPHCFEKSQNYCVDTHGKLYLLDYASEGSQKVLRKYGDALRAKL